MPVPAAMLHFLRNYGTNIDSCNSFKIKTINMYIMIIHGSF
jgi:hypothetical protein